MCLSHAGWLHSGWLCRRVYQGFPSPVTVTVFSCTHREGFHCRKLLLLFIWGIRCRPGQPPHAVWLKRTLNSGCFFFLVLGLQVCSIVSSICGVVGHHTQGFMLAKWPFCHNWVELQSSYQILLDTATLYSDVDNCKVSCISEIFTYNSGF